jgi:hypothetical protein
MQHPTTVPSHTVVTVAPSNPKSLSEVDGLNKPMARVKDSATGQTGFVSREALFPDPGQPIVNVAPITDKAGNTIAYWGNGLGWLPKTEVEAPGFDYDALIAAHDASTTLPPGYGTPSKG